MTESISLGSIQDNQDVIRSVRRDAVANRHLILETAQALFDHEGVAAVSMADIAKAAGVGKGTLYRRFANKGELCLALMDEQMTAFQDRMLAQMRADSAENTPFLDQLAAFLDALVYFVEIHNPLLCEAAQVVDDAEQAAHRPHFWQYKTVSGLLDSAERSGELSSGIDTAFLAEALLAPLSAPTFRYQRHILGFSLDRISVGLRELVFALGC
jgi:AcrR family transcriptional regulator